MEEVIYYTFSTIAQVLAALVGLLGVFAIFHLQYLNKRLDGFSQSYYDTLREEQKNNPANISGFDIEKFRKNQLCRSRIENLQLMGGTDDRYANSIWGHQPIYHSYRTLIERRNAEIKLTIQVAIISVVLILASIIVLPFSGEITQTLFSIIFTLVFLVLTLLMSLIIKLIRSALASNNF